MENILDNIEAIRKEKRIKQEVIAAELGIKQSSYSSKIKHNTILNRRFSSLNSKLSTLNSSPHAHPSAGTGNAVLLAVKSCKPARSS